MCTFKIPPLFGGKSVEFFIIKNPIANTWSNFQMIKGAYFRNPY